MGLFHLLPSVYIQRVYEEEVYIHLSLHLYYPICNYFFSTKITAHKTLPSYIL